MASKTADEVTIETLINISKKNESVTTQWLVQLSQTHLTHDLSISSISCGDDRQLCALSLKLTNIAPKREKHAVDRGETIISDKKRINFLNLGAIGDKQIKIMNLINAEIRLKLIEELSHKNYSYF